MGGGSLCQKRLGPPSAEPLLVPPTPKPPSNKTELPNSTHLDDVPDVELRLGLGPGRAAEAEAHGWLRCGWFLGSPLLIAICSRLASFFGVVGVFGRQGKLKSITFGPIFSDFMKSGGFGRKPERTESLSVFLTSFCVISFRSSVPSGRIFVSSAHPAAALATTA